MVMSMTGYGKGEYENELYKFKIEIKSVNHRYIDISVKAPRQISYLEEAIKKRIKEKLFRGKVDVYINLEYLSESQIDIKIDNELAKSYYCALEELIKNLNLNDNISLNNILNIPDIVKTKKREIDEDSIWKVLNNSLNIALENISYMRAKEGTELKNDILGKLDTINKYVKNIEEKSPEVVIEYKKKLNDRISELIDNNIILDKDRLNNEVAFFADKASIDEEIVRLKSHIKQLKLILEEDESIGRKLDFLIQEFNREINTIGSKSSDVLITGYVVELKSEVEIIREQVQNIE
ncbi:hypothetical protein TICRE_23010 [Tissierella creatinophila DSM 6911]|uniref:YicC-like family, N-terminal region n=2 Tax=Tissierella creatinophila TaxID=79681 RepID=A0A1U7M328_TISCR|nr:hypothetical protein TICRE_23010 [Tissierella creatinophila DSM 6911]